MTYRLTALDLFAGTGWGVACRRLGIEEHGVELMPEAIATRETNGMTTAYHDVWEGLEGNSDVPDYGLLIASPPCQTFSMAGGGAGRKALDEVVGLIDSRAYLDVAKLRAFGETHDPRTALVLTPLAHVARDTPTYVVFEQVPPVLPVWERCAEEMRRWGYSVWVGILNAEQYGVPQTRRRAILIARADGVEAAPPTPTHSRYYSRDPKRLDPGVKPWVSMAEALGWASTMRSNYGTGGDPAARGEREADEPAATVTSKADRNVWTAQRHRGAGMLERHGERAGRPVGEPAPTVTGNASGTTPGGFAWVPADDRIAGPGRSDFTKGGVSRQDRPGTVRVTATEASALQSYPDGFEWRGTKTKQFLQIGNAVPPLLAEAILRTFAPQA